jgi:hypothetical protein
MITKQGGTIIDQAAFLHFQKQTLLRGYALNAWLVSQVRVSCVSIEMLSTRIRAAALAR